ncbi:SDR family NAD(P)-dependent oxidoreductase [Nocardia sp. 348MFTsu5.1]|uniref:SDR family NAD(P)-dependent oxidoreductase n=1 Tax=Nocardia sp. 348MFTsu5.1 TaxID=1172185 RepID=UPI00037FC6B8|nr:SDR family NAD(P)-dependent oxidoreductase [Nocardia sp. 348MFTsu5.1]
MDKLLEGKTAILTGAGSGMGLATARLFHEHGANLVLADISGAQETTAKELGERAVAIQTDVSKTADSKAMVDLAVSEFGGVDILCNIAGANAPMMPFHESSEEDFDKMVNINLRGVFLSMKFAIPELLARGGGSIVNVASTAALIGTPQLASYSAAKSGVFGLTRTVALEYAERKIRANTLCPGTIKTPMMDQGIADNPGAYEYLRDLVPMRRVGTAEEIANGMLFLASDQSSYITGISLPVEGGQTAG